MLYGCDRMGCTCDGLACASGHRLSLRSYPFNHFLGGRPDSEYDEARCECEG